MSKKKRHEKDLKHDPLVSETTTLPTLPQPLHTTLPTAQMRNLDLPNPKVVRLGFDFLIRLLL